MDRLHLSIQLDVFVSPGFSTASETRLAWPASAAGTLSATWIILPSGVSNQQLVYRAPLVLRVEDYSRRAIVSIRYSYVLADRTLQLAKARLLHVLTNLQQEGWLMTPVVDAVLHDRLVDLAQVETHLRWAIQVHYRSGRAVSMPGAGRYSSVVMTEIINRRTEY
jgi:hypothetical protein